MKWISIVLGSILISGCTNQVQVKEPKYKFEKIDTHGVYIELKDKNTQRTCTPALLELNDMYKGIIEFYDYQIDKYMADQNTTGDKK